MFRRHPLKWLLLTAAVIGIFVGIRFRTVPEVPGDHLKLGREALKAEEFSSAEQHFREELRLVTEQPEAIEELTMLLIRSGRNWEASPLVRMHLTQQKIRQDFLVRISGNPDQAIDESMLNDWHQKSPEDVPPLIGLARIAIQNSKTDEAHKLLDTILALCPNELEAHVLKGHAELRTGVSRLSDWNSKLPEGAEGHPGIWFVRGEWCQHAGNPEMATRCFIEGLLLNPDDRNLNLRLGQLLGEEKGQPFLERAETLRRVFNAVAYIKQSGYSQVTGLLKSLQSLGRFQEATHWGQMALTSSPGLMIRFTTDSRFSNEFGAMIAGSQTKEDLYPALKFDLKEFPEWRPPVSESGTQAIVVNRNVRFRNDAASSGLDFTYYNADDPATEGKRLQETTGGDRKSVV